MNVTCRNESERGGGTSVLAGVFDLERSYVSVFFDEYPELNCTSSQWNETGGFETPIASGEYRYIVTAPNHFSVQRPRTPFEANATNLSSSYQLVPDLYQEKDLLQAESWAASDLVDQRLPLDARHAVLEQDVRGKTRVDLNSPIPCSSESSGPSKQCWKDFVVRRTDSRVRERQKQESAGGEKVRFSPVEGFEMTTVKSGNGGIDGVLATKKRFRRHKFRPCSSILNWEQRMAEVACWRDVVNAVRFELLSPEVFLMNDNSSNPTISSNSSSAGAEQWSAAHWTAYLGAPECSSLAPAKPECTQVPANAGENRSNRSNFSFPESWDDEDDVVDGATNCDVGRANATASNATITGLRPEDCWSYVTERQIVHRPPSSAGGGAGAGSPNNVTTHPYLEARDVPIPTLVEFSMHPGEKIFSTTDDGFSTYDGNCAAEVKPCHCDELCDYYDDCCLNCYPKKRVYGVSKTHSWGWREVVKRRFPRCSERTLPAWKASGAAFFRETSQPLLDGGNAPTNTTKNRSNLGRERAGLSADRICFRPVSDRCQETSVRSVPPPPSFTFHVTVPLLPHAQFKCHTCLLPHAQP